MIMVRRLSVIYIRKIFIFFFLLKIILFLFQKLDFLLNQFMDLPYHNTYHYNHEWSVPSSSDHFPIYPPQNSSTTCCTISSCPAPTPSSYYDYYTPSNCCPSSTTTGTYSTPYNTYASFNQPNPTPLNSSSPSNSIQTSSE